MEGEASLATPRNKSNVRLGVGEPLLRYDVGHLDDVLATAKSHPADVARLPIASMAQNTERCELFFDDH